MCQVIAEESLAVRKDPVSPGMKQKLVQKPAVVVHKQEKKAAPSTVLITDTYKCPPHVQHVH